MRIVETKTRRWKYVVKSYGHDIRRQWQINSPKPVSASSQKPPCCPAPWSSARRPKRPISGMVYGRAGIELFRARILPLQRSFSHTVWRRLHFVKRHVRFTQIPTIGSSPRPSRTMRARRWLAGGRRRHWLSWRLPRATPEPPIRTVSQHYKTQDDETGIRRPAAHRYVADARRGAAGSGLYRASPISRDPWHTPPTPRMHPAPRNPHVRTPC